jgi:ubiquinone/menaquinone biosynthesis C-methylase UbiE
MKQDVPPPYSALTRHPLTPPIGHDDAARFNFLANLNKYLSGTLGPGNKIAYDTQVLPAFRAEHGRDPADRHDIRRAMNQNDWHRMWSALKRNSMEMRQHAGRQLVLSNLDMLDAQARQFNEGAATLELSDTVGPPPYQTAVDIHCMPGSYHGEERPGDVSAGANYDAGIFATTGGGLGGLNDGGGQALVEWARKERPDWQPRRILDIGCTVGHNAVPLALGFPDAEVVAIDTAAPVLRYGHARARGLGARNIRFIQMSGEDLSRYPDGHFDWVQTTMFLHELSGSALPQTLRECHRVCAPGGLVLHLEQPQYSDDMPLYEQFIRDWDAWNNNEPFWTAMHAHDLKGLITASGFSKEEQFVTGVRAVVDRTIFPASATDDTEDHGRAAVWHAYGAWKRAA